MEEVQSLQPLLEKFGAWTFEDLEVLGLPEWWRVEIVDGALVVSPSPDGDHELGSSDVRRAIEAALPDGYVVVGPMGVDLGPSYLIPDLVVARRRDVRGHKMLDPLRVPLAVEVVSASSITMDRIVKPAKYAAVGIAHYWRVETDPVILTAYRLSGDVYAEVGSWSSGVVEFSEPFPVTIDLDAVG